MEQNMLHYRIAEHGKIHVVNKNYKEALRYFREAMRMVHQQKDNEVFSQHYSHCVMETLELSGAHEQVISFCENFKTLLNQKEPNDLILKHKAFVYEREAVQHILMQQSNEAKALLKDAQQSLGKGKQPITDDLLNWLHRGYTIDRLKLQNLQKKHDYFIIKKETINHEIALELPEGVAPF